MHIDFHYNIFPLSLCPISIIIISSGKDTIKNICRVAVVFFPYSVRQLEKHIHKANKRREQGAWQR